MENNTLNPTPNNENQGEQNNVVQPPADNTLQAAQPVQEQPAVAPEQPQSVEPTAPQEPATTVPSVTQAPISSASATGSTGGGHKKFATVAVGLVTLVVGLAVGFVGAAATGTSFVKTEDTKKVSAPVVNEENELTVPEGATVISECAPRRGKQYILPKDIPMGPVYNVWEGKVIGIEYMLGQEQVLGNQDFLNLSLKDVRYNHVNIGLLSKGHTGYPTPHYHVDLFTITHEESNKITCK